MLTETCILMFTMDTHLKNPLEPVQNFVWQYVFDQILERHSKQKLN